MRDNSKVKTIFVIQLCIMLLFSLFFKTSHINEMFLIIMATFFINIIYGVCDLKNKILFLVFHGTFFTFLLGKILIDYLSGNKILSEFSIEVKMHIMLSLFLSLIALFAGIVIYDKMCELKPLQKRERQRTKIDNIIFSKIVVICMYITLIPYYLTLLEKGMFVQSNTYIDLYSHFESMLPAIVNKVGNLYPIFFIAFLATMPNRKKIKFPAFLYVFSGFLALGYGQRNLIVLNSCILIIYGFYRNLFCSKEKKWITKKMIIPCLVIMPLIISFLFIFQSTRYDLTSGATNIFDAMKGFFYSQGGSVEVIGYGKQFQNLLPNSNFTFGPLITSLNNNQIIHRLFNTHILTPYTVEMATQGNIFAHSLTYLYSKNLYLNGGGLGSCYIAELYQNFSYMGILIINLIYGFALGYIFKKRYNIIGLSIAIYIMRNIIYVPRDSALGFIAEIFTITNIFIISLIYIFALYIRRTKLYKDKFLKNKTDGDVLVLLTNMYPLSRGETFLETEELFYDVFDKTLIIPFHLETIETNEMRGTNHEVLLLNSRFMLLIKLNSLFKAIFNFEILNEIFHLIIENEITVGKVKQIISLSYRGELYCTLIVKSLKDRFINANRIMFYAYWLNVQAICAIKLSKIYENSFCISRAHGIDLYSFRNKNNYQAMRTYLNSGLNYIYFISTQGKEYYEANYGMNSKYRISYLGVMNKIKFSVNNKPSKFHIVSCSMLIPLKRIHLIIETLELINDIEIVWTHIGNGDLLDNLENVARNKLQGNIHYEFIGMLTNAEIMNYYSTHKISLFLSVSITEGLPVSIMEAMSFGIPVIATKVGAVGEIVSDKKNGYLLEKDFEIEELASLIKKVEKLSNEDFIELSKAAYKTWETNFNAEINYTKFLQNIWEG